MDANSQQAKYLSRKTVKFFREKKNSNGIKQNNRISVCKKKMCFVHFMWYYETCSNRGIWSMADYIDNSCHIDQTTNVIDEVDILGTYATIQNHQNDEISTSSTILVSICAVPINIFFFFLLLTLFDRVKPLKKPTRHAKVKVSTWIASQVHTTPWYVKTLKNYLRFYEKKWI